MSVAANLCGATKKIAGLEKNGFVFSAIIRYFVSKIGQHESYPRISSSLNLPDTYFRQLQ